MSIPEAQEKAYTELKAEMAEFFERKLPITWDKAKEAFGVLKFLLSFL